MTRALLSLTVLVVCACLPGATHVTAAESAGSASPEHRSQSIRFMDFEDITPAEGLLLKRARYTFEMYRGYTPEHVLTLNYSTTPSDHAFPGDTIGRYILSATLLSRALRQPEPETLRKVMAALPAMLNAEGYLGWVLPPDRADETGLSNAMWSNGLTEYYLWTRDAAALEMNRNVFARILLPLREAYYYYYSPEKTDGRIKWVHCTGDTAQAFGIIDPATRGYALFPSSALRSEINELIRLYQKIDPVAIRAQIHAVLFTTRGVLRWYDVEHNPAHLQFAEDLYGRYRRLAMTEDYENYNWFGRPDWTEGCAIVDSFTVAARLWRLTGKAGYLEDAQLILFNGLLANQKDGDFGINNCVGPAGQIFLKPGSAAPWCCSVWGGKGLARAFQYSYFQSNDGLMVTIPGNSTVTAPLPGGRLTLKQTTAYPHGNGIRFEVVASESRRPRSLAVFLPSWIKPGSLALAVNGRSAEWSAREGFLVLRRAMQAGDVIELGFEQRWGAAPLVCPERSPGFHRYMHGPLVLGADTAAEQKLPLGTPLEALGSACYRAGDVTLTPLCDLADRRDPAHHARSGSIQVLFGD